MAAIIHELLHIKYEKNEQEVRKLTKKYFRKFNKDKIPFAAAKFLFFTQNYIFKTNFGINLATICPN